MAQQNGYTMYLDMGITAKINKVDSM
jgi:hypothetical protein